VGKVFGAFMSKFMTGPATPIWDLLKIIFEVVAPGANALSAKSRRAIKKIFSRPISLSATW